MTTRGSGDSEPARGRRRSRTLRGALAVLIAAVLLPLCVAGSAFITSQWRQRREAAFARLQDHARTLQRAVDRELSLDLAVLRTLAESPNIDTRDWRSFHATAAKAAEARPGSWVALYEPSGQNVINTRVPFGSPLPNLRQLRSSRADADWEGRKIPLLDLGCLFGPLETGKPCFSGLVYGVVTRRPAVGMIIPVMRSGKAVYVLALVYSSQVFENVLVAERAPDTVASIWDQRGLFIARSRDSEKFVGLPGPTPFKEGAGKLPREGVGETINIESIPFVYAHNRSGVADVVVVAGMAKAAVLAPAWRALWLWLAVLVCSGGIGAFFAFRLWRGVGAPLAALAQQARSMGEAHGDVAYTGIQEVEALRDALRDRARAETEVRSLAQFPTENPNPVLRASIDGRVLYSNGAGEVLLRTMGWQEGGPLPEPLLAEVRRVPEKGTIAGHDITTPDSRVWSFTLSASSGEGHVNLFGRDTTDRKRSEEALREADRRKDEFLGMLSHELRNPLAPIRNSLYVLDHAEPTSQAAHRAKEVAGRQLTHLTRLVDDLLDVTRIGRGKIELRRTDLDLAELTRRIADDHRTLMTERGLQYDIEAPHVPVWVNGDETRLAQVIGNLLQNAAKFTPEGGRITVSVISTPDAVEVQIRDTGGGIEPELLANIFVPFVQAKQSLARTQGGLGLGLALVKALVEMHGGTVTVESAGRDRGAVFTVKLPVVQTASTAEAPAPLEPRSTTKMRVLVVEDNKDAAESLADLVRMLGHDATVAFDGWTAVKLVRNNPPDIVLCDIGLPGMNGYQVAQALRTDERFDSVQLIAVSGYAQPEDRQRALDAGFADHIAKPADPAKVLRVLGRGEQPSPA